MKCAPIKTIVSVPAARSRKRVRTREWPRPPRRDPHTRLITQLLELAGPNSSVIATSSRPWASATFLGAQHRMTLQITGDDQIEHAENLANALPDAEFSISGHIVADACVDQWHMSSGVDDAQDAATVLHLSVLTIEDW